MQTEKEGKGRKRNGREDRKEKRQEKAAAGLPHSKSARLGKRALRKKEPG
jgi:hypothetical protein